MRSKQAVKNSFIGISSQIITMLVAFITRKLFVYYLGIEILGINGVILNLLNMLSLAELGVGTAITYNLYRPLINNDEDTVCALMNLYGNVYKIIGTCILFIGIIIMFLLEFIIKESTININFIRVAYIIQLISIVFTYFLAYKRTLIYANQKEYIITIYDTLINVIFSIIRIILLVAFKSYILYLIVQIIQTIISNILISNKCNEMYPYIKEKNKFSYKNKNKLFMDTKNVLFGKIAGYVYASTDNLVISTFIGVKYVGLLSNYTFISSAVKSIIGSLINPIQPIIGNYLNDISDKNNTINILNCYTFIRYILANICIVPLIVLMNPFIQIWIGKEYIMSINIVIIISIDLFISIVHGPVGEYINGLGLFKYEKYVSILGAIINLSTSIILAKYIGIEGVLIGTVISQMFFWMGRSYIVFKYYFKSISIQYWIRNISYIIVITIQIIIVNLIGKPILEEPNILKIILVGAISVIICVLSNLIAYRKTTEYSYIRSMITKIIKKDKRKCNRAM